VVAIAPGYVGTPMVASMKPEVLENVLSQVPIGRLISTDEIAQTIEWIITNEAVHGTTIEIAGGLIGKGVAR
jgi:3-oxoacyl-[acyl-carrier protein] reductase